MIDKKEPEFGDRKGGKKMSEQPETRPIDILVPTDCPTIQGAIDMALDGHRVLVSPGMYVENIDFKGKRVTIQGRGAADNTVLIGTGSGSVLTASSGETEKTTLRNMAISGGTGTPLMPTGYRCGGGAFVKDSGLTLENCIIKGNSCFAPSGHSGNRGVGAGLFAMSGVVHLIGCAIYANSVDEKGAAVAAGDSTINFINTTIFGNDSNFGILYLSQGCESYFSNSILWGNYSVSDEQIILRQDSFMVVRSSCVENGTSCFLGGNLEYQSTNIEEDPGLFSYKILQGSPCMDTGDNDLVGTLTDIDGASRIVNGFVDMGCYEIQA